MKRWDMIGRSSWVWTMICVFIVVSMGCSATSKYKAVANPAKLKLEFADAKWDGKLVPDGQQCKLYGGKGATPRIIVHNVPADANAIIMEFSDASWPPMDNGGHGIIGYRIPPNSIQITIPSAPGNTFELPDEFFQIAAHTGSGFTKGAYLPPCSGGKKNQYYVTVKAVYDAPKGEPCKMLGKGVLQMGAY